MQAPAAAAAASAADNDDNDEDDEYDRDKEEEDHVEDAAADNDNDEDDVEDGDPGTVSSCECCTFLSLSSYHSVVMTASKDAAVSPTHITNTSPENM